MSASITKAKVRPPLRVQGYTHISTAALKTNDSLALELYRVSDDGKSVDLYRGRDYAVSREDFDRLEHKGIFWLYLKTAEYRRLEKHLRRNVQETVSRLDLESPQRFAALSVAVSSEVEHAFGQIKADAAVETSHEVGTHLVNALYGGRASPEDVFCVMQHDYYTFTHLINVASFSVLLAQRLGVDDEQDLQEIAAGGLLHDVGKRYIPLHILNKPGRLTDEEFEIIKQHPQDGFEDLVGRSDVTHAQLMMTYQHHERLDGRGYPVGITDDEIHPWAKICAVADVFDALTSKRPYRKAMPVEEAFGIMEQSAGRHLDREMVSCWKRAMLPT